MASIDEVLAGMSAPAEEEDEALCFVIDKDLRIITIPERGVVLGVEGDKDVNRVRFRMSRYYHGIDLSGFNIRINYQNAEGDKNYFTVTEKTADEDSLSFVWTITADAALYKGTVYFVVYAFTMTADGAVEQAYHTTLGDARVLEGLDVNAAVEAPEIVDLAQMLKNELTEHANGLTDDAEKAAKEANASATAAANSASNAAGSATAASRSASAAAGSASNAESSASSASSSATAAGNSATAAKTSETNAGSSATAASNSATAAQSSATAAASSAANAGSSATKAANSATAAGNSATAASGSATKAGNSATAAKTSETNAATSETNAKTSEANAKKYADEVRTVAEGYKGWFETEAALTTSVPNGTKGDWAIVGSTNSIWIWDVSANVWAESVPRIDLTNYPTNEELTKRLEKYLPNRAATAAELGGIKVGKGLSIDVDGNLTADVQEYILPAATADKLGGVKVGDYLDVAEDGTLSGKTLNDRITAAAAVTSDPRAVWSFVTDGTNSSKKSIDTAVPSDVDYVSIRTSGPFQTKTFTYDKLVRGGSLQGNFVYGSNDATATFKAVFSAGGTLTVTLNSNPLGYLYFNYTGYHYPTVAELLTETQTAQADADAVNVDQEYRLTLLELGVSDDETT